MTEPRYDEQGPWWTANGSPLVMPPWVVEAAEVIAFHRLHPDVWPDAAIEWMTGPNSRGLVLRVWLRDHPSDGVTLAHRDETVWQVDRWSLPSGAYLSWTHYAPLADNRGALAPIHWASADEAIEDARLLLIGAIDIEVRLPEACR